MTRPGDTLSKMLGYLNQSPDVTHNCQVIVLHVGANYLSHRNEWALYQEVYTQEMSNYTSPPAGHAITLGIHFNKSSPSSGKTTHKL